MSARSRAMADLARHFDWLAAAATAFEHPAHPAGSCTVAPAGWYCTLPNGHAGPCPAWPLTEPPAPGSVLTRAEHWHAAAEAARRHSRNATWPARARAYLSARTSRPGPSA